MIAEEQFNPCDKTEPFKITELGFYRMQNGGKCKVIDIDIEREFNAQVSYTFGMSGIDCCRLDGGRINNCNLTIVAKWKEPRKVSVPEIVVFETENGLRAYVGAEPMNGKWKIIKTIPAQEIEVED